MPSDYEPHEVIDELCNNTSLKDLEIKRSHERGKITHYIRSFEHPTVWVLNKPS